LWYAATVSETTLGTPPAITSDGDRWTLVVVGPGDLRTHTLTIGAQVVIGRDAEADLRIDHPSISRRHARLTIDATCTIEDIGSRNGTVVRGETLATGDVRTLAPGEAFGIGPFSGVLVPERGAAIAPAPSSLVVEDPAPRTPTALLVSVARSPLTVLVRGESGAGKEVLAETLHRLSGRTGSFLRLNCATFHAELLESELFGHERGAFTGAVAAKAGLLEVASGGTVFLDEVGELPGPLQARLLRAIESREVMRVGGTKPIPIDARFIAATNRDLQAEIARGAFRLDLYYRLAVVTLTVPPLRARLARILHIAQELAAAAAKAAGRPAPRFAPSAVARLQAHSWPGNVRELRNVIERALLLSPDGELGAEHIILDTPPAQESGGSVPSTGASSEKARIIAALDECAGNQTRAAKLLGMSRATLATKLAIHNIPRPRAR
jgi:DNA-binding NtrC family response regulator